MSKQKCSARVQGLGCASINFNNKACRQVPTIRIYIHLYTVKRNRVYLCLQGSGDLRMCGSHTDRNTARILMFCTFWDDILMFYLAFGVYLMLYTGFCRRAVRVYQGMRFHQDIFNMSGLSNRGVHLSCSCNIFQQLCTGFKYYYVIILWRSFVRRSFVKVLCTKSCGILLTHIAFLY